VPIAGFADPFSSISHLAGGGVALLMSPALFRRGLRAADRSPTFHGVRVLSLAVFATSAVLLLSMSGVFHLLSRGGAPRAVLQRLDHAAIFVLIAGTFTPVHTILFRGVWSWGILGFVWTVAVTGLVLKTIYLDSIPEIFGLSLYIGLGWVGAVSVAGLWRRYGPRLLPLLWGGAAYTAGAIIEWANPPPLVPGFIGAHEVFHLAVLAGLALHWRFVASIAGEVAFGGSQSIGAKDHCADNPEWTKVKHAPTPSSPPSPPRLPAPTPARGRSAR
jgi:channel protein (hemolysin III family)